jgi:tRNA(fMet)-specific endonuclease VapC
VTRYLFDTGIAGDYMNRRNGVHDRARQVVTRGHRIGIVVPVLGELRGGVELSASRERNHQRLEIALAAWTVWPFDERAAREFGRLFALLRRAGRSMQTVDIQLAAVAFSLGNCVVVSADSDLRAIPGLTVENWAGP